MNNISHANTNSGNYGTCRKCGKGTMRLAFVLKGRAYYYCSYCQAEY